MYIASRETNQLGKQKEANQEDDYQKVHLLASFVRFLFAPRLALRELPVSSFLHLLLTHSLCPEEISTRTPWPSWWGAVQPRGLGQANACMSLSKESQRRPRLPFILQNPLSIGLPETCFAS